MCLDPRVGIQRHKRLIMLRDQADVTRPSRPWRAKKERDDDLLASSSLPAPPGTDMRGVTPSTRSLG